MASGSRIRFDRLRQWLAGAIAMGARTPMAKPFPVRGVHWFAQHDPLSFWESFDESETNAQFREIRKDGFNTVFLLIPWHAFFPANDARLSEWMLSRLTFVLGVARRNRLAVIGRLFYSHSHLRSGAERSHERQYALLTDPEAVRILALQAGALADVVRAQPAWVGEFVSWEDFFPIFDGPPHWAPDRRRQLARESGFADWLAQRPSAATPDASPGAIEPEGVEVPVHGSPAMRSWIRFFDHVLSERVIQPIEAAFPRVGLEVRSDAYPIPQPDGRYSWEPFDLHPELGERRYAYWGAYFGQRNEGETLSESQALAGLAFLLDLFPRDVPLVLGQFNFRDSTLDFAAHHARLDEAVIPAFMEQARKMLSERRWGYALWAGRDYRENWLSNAAFQLGMQHWEAGPASLPKAAAGRGLLLAVGESISQRVTPGIRTEIAPGKHAAFHCEVYLGHPIDDLNSIALTLDGHPLGPGECEVGAGRRSVRWLLPEDRVRGQASWQEGFVLRIENRSERRGLVLKRACVWGFTQSLGVRSAEGEPGPYLAAIKAMNAGLAGE